MSLKKLTICFQKLDDLFKEVNEAINVKGSVIDSEEMIFFDSIKTFRSFMTSNKSNILSVISKLKPTSVYELANYLDRKPQHVLSDCRSLESHGFIKLIQEEVGRKSLRPELVFDYDVILIDDKSSTPLTISEKSERIINDAIAS